MDAGETPVHLYVDGSVLLFGGMALTKSGKLKSGCNERDVVHQAAHVDFFNERWTHCNECELLNGLAKPFSVNIAVEDQREIYMKDEKNKVPVMLNDILLVGGSTVHGGTTYVCDKDDIKYHPSLHFVFQSKRFKKTDEEVGLTNESGSYCHASHLTVLQAPDFHERMMDCFKSMKTIGNEAYNEEKRNEDSRGLFDKLLLNLTKHVASLKRENKISQKNSATTKARAAKKSKNSETTQNSEVMEAAEEKMDTVEEVDESLKKASRTNEEAVVEEGSEPSGSDDASEASVSKVAV